MARDSFTKEQEKRMAAAIKEAETHTSGEIQIHLENHCKIEVLDRAARIFSILKMHKTELRSGVLFYMAVKDHKFAILGDIGINKAVPDDFWEDIKSEMLEYFQKDDITEGLCVGVKMAGKQLSNHFPKLEGNINELPDEISFGD